jgi:hypothetical protein
VTDLDPTLAKREQWRDAKRRQRADKAATLAAEAQARIAGYTLPRMPAGLRGIRLWLRDAHEAFEAGRITTARLTEARRSASAVGDLYRVGADLRKAQAAIRAAEAQEQMAHALAAVEHGGTAVLMLARLQEGLSEGRRRPLPHAGHAGRAGRVLPMQPGPDGGAA